MQNKQEIQEFWRENGYYHAKGVFGGDELRALQSDFDRIVAQLQSGGENINARWGGEQMKKLDGGAGVILHTHNVQQFSGNWLRAFLQPQFLGAAEAMLGPDILLHHSKLFQKPPENGAPFPMHQDWTYFPTFNDSMMAAVIHVSDATNEMGCLRVYPGTHKLGRVEGTAGNQASELLDKYPIEDATIVEAAAGDVVFFHYFTLHGSMPNRSQSTRKTVLLQMYAGDDAVEPRGAGHPDEKLVLQGWNARASRDSAGQTK